LTFLRISGILFVMKVKDTMKTYKIETEDRYNQFREYDLEAESLEAATATAEKRVNLPNGAFVIGVKEI
jgi:hypothetical protein